MKASTKIGIGLSIAAIASVSVAVVASEKIVKKIEHVSNRCKAKKFVNDTFSGNETLLNVVDDLSDAELDSVMTVLTKVKEGRKTLESYGETIKEDSENLKNRFLSFIEALF